MMKALGFMRYALCSRSPARERRDAPLALLWFSVLLLAVGVLLPAASAQVTASPTTVGIPEPTSGSGALTSNGTAYVISAAGTGTVTSVSVVTANGVSGSVATATSTPAITLTLGAITPTTVNGLTITSSTGTLTIANSKTFTASNTLTLAGTDGSALNIGTGGTLGTAAYTAASAYEVPLTFGDGLTRTANDVDVDVTQTINAITAASATDLTLAAGSSGATFALAQGANGGAAVVLKGTAGATITKSTSPALPHTSMLGVSTPNGSNPPIFIRDFPKGNGASTIGNNFGAALRLGYYPSDGTAAANDGIGLIFMGRDSGGNDVTYATLEAGWTNTTVDQTAGHLLMYLEHGGDRNHSIFFVFRAHGTSTKAGQLLGMTGRELAFGANDTEAGRFTLGGNLLIGGTTDIGGSGGLKVFGTTASTTKDTGAVIVEGGVGIEGNINAGGNIVATGTLSGNGGSLGAATATTPGADDNDTSVATTAYVQTELTAYASDAVPFTNKTFDASGTGNVVKLFQYLIIATPSNYGSGVTQQTTATDGRYGQALFSNSTDKATNYVEYRVVVPPDIDTAVDLTASFKFYLGGADTNDHEYEISFDSIANSADKDGTLGDAISLAYTADASGADDDVETAGETTLTGWRSALTAGQLMVIRVARDGDHASDTSTVNSYSGPLVIKYGISQ